MSVYSEAEGVKELVAAATQDDLEHEEAPEDDDDLPF